MAVWENSNLYKIEIELNNLPFLFNFCFRNFRQLNHVYYSHFCQWPVVEKADTGKMIARAKLEGKAV